MSYTRHYQGSVSGSRTVSVSYPASEHGGSTSTTVDITIPVSIAVSVDTSPFDREIDSCERQVDQLTASVVATEVAQISAIRDNADAVAEHVTSGFFGLIRSELTQQMAEYRSAAQALAVKLSEMKEACVERIAHMGADYARIATRYSTLFRDLDTETATRVGALDDASFRVKAAISAESKRPHEGKLSTTATVGSSESSRAQAMVLTAGVRQSANRLLAGAHSFLMADRRLTSTIERLLRREAVEESTTRYLPVLYRASDAPGASGGEELITSRDARSPLAADACARTLLGSFGEQSLPWRAMTPAERAQIDVYLNRLIEQLQTGDAGHRDRVCRMLLQLWSTSQPQIL